MELIRKYIREFTFDKDVIDELSQIVGMKIHMSNKKIEDEHSYRKWVKSIVRNVYIDYYRRMNSKKADLFINTDEDWGVSDLNPDDHLIQREAIEHIAKCIDRLPEKQRDVVYMRYYIGLDYFQIAKAMRCPKNTALSHMYYAKQNLKKLL